VEISNREGEGEGVRERESEGKGETVKVRDIPKCNGGGKQ